MKRGMLVGVLRRASFGDCTNGGVTSRQERFILFGVEGPFAPDEGEQALLLKYMTGGYMYAVPCDEEGNEIVMPGLIGPMMGGNFVYTGDSRFREVNDYPIPVHDRWESQEQYDALSR